jgi:DNA-binding MarR family transcriptional regulator
MKSGVSDRVDIPCTHFRLRQLLRAVSRLYDAEIGKAGLRGTQYSLLAHLAVLAPVQPAELARHLGMDASTLSRNLRPLLAAGWVSQIPGADARSRQLQLTPEGDAKRREARRHWRRAQTTLEERYGAAQVLALHGLIDQGLQRLAGPEFSGSARS